MSRLDIRLIPPSETTDLSKSISEVLKIEPTETIIKKFANGETYVNIVGNMRNKDVYILPVVGKHINDNLFETYLKADAAKRMGAHKVIAILPNFPYARQERKVEDGEPISARLNMSLLHGSGVDEVITSDMHTAALQGFARQMRIAEVSSLNVMKDYIQSLHLDLNNLVVVSPDLGGVKRADKFGQALGCDRAVIYKHRTAHNEAKAEFLLGDVQGKDCVIYDDLIDTAGTICEAAKKLKHKGANKIYVCASHGLFNGKAIERLEEAPIEEVIVTNSEVKPVCSKIKQVDIAPIIVGAILEISA